MFVIFFSAQLEGDKTITLRTSSILEALKWNIIAVVFNVQEGVMEIYNNGKVYNYKIHNQIVYSVLLKKKL